MGIRDKILDMVKSETLVIYHDQCRDGICAAAILFEFLKNSNCDMGLVKFIPGAYNNLRVGNLDSRHLIMLDMNISNLPKDLVTRISEKGDVIVIDHHPGTGSMSTCPNIVYAPSKEECGTSLLYKTLYPGRGLPMFIEWIKDYDCWLQKYRDTHAFNLGMGYINSYDLSKWVECIREFHGSDGQSGIAHEDMVMTGERVKDTIRMYYSMLVKHESMAGNHRAVFIESSVWINELADITHSEGLSDVAVIWFYDVVAGMYKYSLRSNSPEFDCTDLAKKYGGGGHRRAAGFSSDTLLLSI